MMTETQLRLQELEACREAIEWLGNRSLEEGWQVCPRADWMLWLVGKVARKFTPQMRICTCEIVRTQLHLIPQGEDRPRITVETAERHARGEATDEELATAEAMA